MNGRHRRMTAKAVVIYDPHPHVSIFREFAGYIVNTIADEEDEDNSNYLSSLDPKNWKTNDHYAVLNLKKLRHKASDDEIRRKYRKIILKNHPDKRRARGEEVKDESHDYFACITQAFEILGNPTRRHAYDSVDPLAVDETVPTVSQVTKDFFGCLGPIFIENARWSKQQPVPFLGYKHSPINSVHRFYDFWDCYETTKDFSFLDEEDKETGEDRYARRHIERQNRSERAQKRADEHKRIRQILELAREHDPRLIAESRSARLAKEAKKQERLLAAQRRREEEEERARIEAAAVEEARAASEERKRLENEKIRREKEALKAASKREKKRLRNICVERHDHFIVPGLEFAGREKLTTGAGEIKIQTLQDVDLLCQALSHIELRALNDRLDSSKTPMDTFETWRTEVCRVRKATEAPGFRDDAKTDNSQNGVADNGENSKWTYDMSQSLIKAVNLFPAGTQKRWEVIAAYVNQHVKDVSVTGKEALKHAKSLRNDDGSLKQEANTKAFDNFNSKIKQSEATKSVTITDKLEADSIRPWTVSEQRALELALRKHPQVPGEPSVERWQHIADTIGTRTRKECMLRYKDLAEQVQKKRAAMTAAGVNTKI